MSGECKKFEVADKDLRKAGVVTLEGMIGKQKMPGYAIEKAGGEAELAKGIIRRILSWSGLSLQEVQELAESVPDLKENGNQTNKVPYLKAIQTIRAETENA